MNQANTEQSNHDQSSSERMKRSYQTKYSNRNDDDQKHTTAISYFIPVAKSLGSTIEKDSSFTPEYSCSNIKIGLEDTRFHITHAKTSDVQKAGLENDNHLVRPNYQLIKKQTSTKNYTKRACIIMACEQVACNIFNSRLIDTLKSTIVINKIHFRDQTNEEKKLHKTSFCNEHYDQLLLITQCQLCGNRSLQKFKLHEDIVHEYQLILDEDNIPATIKYDTLICKPCKIYLLLRRDKTTIIQSELQKHCDATKTRIINNNKLKTKKLESIKLAKNEINMGNKKEENQLLMVTSLPKNRSNAFTDYSSIPSKSVTKGSALDDITIPPPLVNSTPVTASMQLLTAVISTTIETAMATEEAHLTTITKPILETPTTAALTKATEDVKLTVATRKPTGLIFKRKRQHTFQDEHSSVPRTKKRIVNRSTKTDRPTDRPTDRLTDRPTVTTDCIKHIISEHKPTIPVLKQPTIPSIKPTTPVNKPTIPVHKPLYNKSLVFSSVLRPIFSSKWPVPKKQLFKNCKVQVDKPTINLDHKILYKKSIVFSPVLRPYFNSKRSIPKKYKKTPKLISQIRKPTKLQTNQLHQSTLDSRSTLPCTKFSELSHQQADPSILSSTTPDMNQVFENIRVPIDKPVIPVEKPMILVNKPTITNYTLLDSKSPVGPMVFTPFFSSKCTELKKNGNPLVSVSPIIEPTQLQENKLHQHTLDSLSMSLQTEFPEVSLHRGEPSTLSSTTSDMNQIFENLNVPVNKTTITDHKRLNNKSPIFSPVLSTFSSSKCTTLNKYEKTPESVSPIKKLTQLQTNESHQNMLNPQSTSPRTEYSKLSHQQADPSILSSTTSDMNQIFENLKVPIDKPVIPVEKPMIPVNKPTITNYTLLDNKSPVDPPVIGPFFSSKCTELKKNGNPLISVSPIIEPTQLQENKLHQHTLDSLSMSLQTEFPEASHQQVDPSILSSTTSDMNQIFENLNVPVDKSTITNHERLDNKSPVDQSVIGPFLSSKCTELKKNENPLESVSPIKKPTQLQTNQSNQNTLDPQSTSPRTEFPELRRQQASPTTLSSTTPYMIQLFEKLKSPYPNGMTFINHLLNMETCRNLGALTLEKNKTTYRQQTSNTATTPPHSTHCPAVADSTTSTTDSTTAINNTEVPVITNTVTINYDKSEITSMVNENTTIDDTAAVEESSTLTMISNVTSTTTNTAVSITIDADSFTAVTTAVTDDATSVEITSESSSITNAITTESPNSAKCTDAFTEINASPITSDNTTTTETFFETTTAASKISYDSEITSNKNTVATIPPIQCVSRAPC